MPKNGKNQVEDEDIKIENTGVIDYSTCESSKVFDAIYGALEYLRDNGKDKESLIHLNASFSTLKMLEDAIKKREDKNVFKAKMNGFKQAIADSTVLPNSYLKEIYTNFLNGSKIEEETKKAREKFFNAVPEEDRYKPTQYSNDFSKNFVAPVADIVSFARTAANSLPKTKVNSPKEMKKNIMVYKTLKKAHDQKPWYKRAWSFITGNKENKAIENLKNAIINSTQIPRNLMEKAFKTNFEDHLDIILFVGEKASKEVIKNEIKETKSRENISISNDEVEPNQVENTKDNLEKTNTVSKSESVVEEDDFEVEVDENNKVVKEKDEFEGISFN